MSKDKTTSKRMYSIRGAATRRKRRAKGGGGKKSKPGHSYVSCCPECPRDAEGSKVAVDANTKEVNCKAGHTWKVT